MENDNNVAKVNLQEVADKQNVEREVVHKVDLSQPAEAEEADVLDEMLEIAGVDDNAEQKLETQEADEKEELRVQALTEETEEQEQEQEIDEQTSNEEEDEEVLVELTEEVDALEEELEEALADEATNGVELPENIKKLMSFMEDTGGDLEDYLLLNKDVSSLSDEDLLRQYHASQEPDLTTEEIDFLIEDLYEVDEFAEEREAKKKSIARKRALTKAKQHIESRKEKYYEDIKAGSKLTDDQKKAVDFFNRYKQDQEEVTKLQQKQSKVFKQKTDSVFNDKFKGFEFKVGEKRYRYNVKDPAAVKESQNNLENFTKKYLGDDNTLGDAKGYHKALFTAMNADAIAEHFYNQGAADAVKTSAATKKNINMTPRKDHSSTDAPQTGFRARVVPSDSQNTGKLKFKK